MARCTLALRYFLFPLYYLRISVFKVRLLQLYESPSLFLSTENVDLVGRRERFLRSNFESLSGAEDGSKAASSSAANGSFTNAFRESALKRNAKTIARAQSFRDDEQNRKREELQKRIEETRKKLQNVSGDVYWEIMDIRQARCQM